jgi:nitrogen fixation protein NifX
MTKRVDENREGMKEGNVSEDRILKAAFATKDKLTVNAGFEQARYIVVYEINTTAARQCAIMTYHAASSSDAGCLKGHGRKGPGGGGGCGGGRKKEDEINEHEILTKVAGLAGISVLFVNKALNAFSALALNDTRVFTVKVDDQKEIADVIARLQEMLGNEPPRWLRRALIGEHDAVEA